MSTGTRRSARQRQNEKGSEETEAPKPKTKLSNPEQPRLEPMVPGSTKSTVKPRKRKSEELYDINREKLTLKRQKGRTSKSQVQGSKVKAEFDLEAGAKLAASVLPDAVNGSTIVNKGRAGGSSKADSYGLSPGESPYPKYPHPTPKECELVAHLLSSVHGEVQVPKSIPAPSLTASGCGEVPSVLDALVRTRLSAATNNANSSRAFRGLVDKFGTLKNGVGKGSVDWDKVRTANVKDVFEAIRTGGLADVKSRDIQKILQMVYEENQESGKNGILSLDHLHDLSNDEAFSKLLNYPGIGPKTASCVLLFCMQRPSFAVDTHVFRLAGFLHWMPTESQAKSMLKKGEAKVGSVTRNTAYSHLEVRVPDHLKYPLHYLLIKHGKTCPYCSAKKDKSVTDAWGNKPCPLRKAGLINGKLGHVSLVKEEIDVGT